MKKITLMIKIRIIGWFFVFIWCCIKDLRTPLDCINDIGLFKENWNDFKTKIYFVTDPDAIETTRKLSELSKK